jgi:hypothetical protein
VWGVVVVVVGYYWVVVGWVVSVDDVFIPLVVLVLISWVLKGH